VKEKAQYTEAFRRQALEKVYTRGRRSLKAGVRGSDYDGISDVIYKSFSFWPTPDQLRVLERQIIDRRRE